MVDNVTTTAVLDQAAWAALDGGPQAHLARGEWPVRRFPSDVALFLGFAPDAVRAGRAAWDAAAALVDPGEVVAYSGSPELLEFLPPEWTLLERGEGVQLVSTDALTTAPDPDAVVLGEADVPEILDLVARTKPGPFLPRTVDLGTYLGLREDGRLVALAGERLHPPGYTEISAVCTDSAYRGRGYATRLVRAVADGIRARGEVPMLHAAGSNVNAIRLYEELGFVLRRRIGFFAVRAPE